MKIFNLSKEYNNSLMSTHKQCSYLRYLCIENNTLSDEDFKELFKIYDCERYITKHQIKQMIDLSINKEKFGIKFI